MSSFKNTRVDYVEFVDNLKYQNLPLCVDDMTLAHHLGIRNKTLWFLIWNKNKQYHVFRIHKRGKSSGFRDIQNPKPRLKTVQRLILGKILECIPVGKHIGAYIPGRSCMSTATQHLKRSLIISMDIKDFFPSVKRYMVRKFFKGLGYNHLVSSLLADLVTYKNFVPQGAPTSGLVANLVADVRFDRPIIESLRKLDPDWRYTRYSDDIDISHGKDQPHEKIKEVINLVQKHISAAGFTVNYRKTKVEPRWKRQKVLGIIVNDRPNIPRLEYDRLRCLIHNCMVHGFESQYKKAGQNSAEALKVHIQGKLSFLKQINTKKAARLQEEFDLARTVDNLSKEAN